MSKILTAVLRRFIHAALLLTAGAIDWTAHAQSDPLPAWSDGAAKKSITNFVAIYGGAAGGGKTWALLMGTVRRIHNPDFGAVTLRRESPQITNEGGSPAARGQGHPPAASMDASFRRAGDL